MSAQDRHTAEAIAAGRDALDALPEGASQTQKALAVLNWAVPHVLRGFAAKYEAAAGPAKGEGFAYLALTTAAELLKEEASHIDKELGK